MAEFFELPGEQSLRRKRSRDIRNNDRQFVGRSDQFTKRPALDWIADCCLERVRFISQTWNEFRLDHSDLWCVDFKFQARGAVLQMNLHLMVFSRRGGLQQ